jgi:hypothetical protein
MVAAGKIPVAFDTWDRGRWKPNLVPDGPEWTEDMHDGSRKWSGCTRPFEMDVLGDQLDPVAVPGRPGIQPGNRPWLYPISPIGGHSLWTLGPDRRDTGRLFPGISEEALEGFRTGLGFLWISQANEGFPVGDAFFRMIHYWCERNGIAPRKVIYTTSNTRALIQYAVWCSERNVPLLDRFKIISYSMFQMACAREYQRSKDDASRFVTEELFIAALGSKRRKKFISLNRRPHRHRLAAVLYMLQRGLLQHGYVSFPAEAGWPEHYHTDIHPVVPVGTVLHDWLMSKFSDLQSMCPLVVDERDLTVNRAYGSDLSAPYFGSVWNLTTETMFGGGDTIFMSEKIFKPIMNLQPFLVLGPPATLASLRVLGYETFDGLVDESYDVQFDPTARFMMVMDELRKLCALSDDELAQHLVRVDAILINNRRRLLSRIDSADTAVRIAACMT